MGCISKDDPKIDELILDQSEVTVPYWTRYDFLESQYFYYFISNFSTQSHTPSFSYMKARRGLYGFLEKDIQFILYPLKPHMSKSEFIKLKKSFLEYLAQEIILEIRKTKDVFWQKIKTIDNQESLIQYRYYILIKLNEKKLRLYERKFIAKEILKTQFNYQTLIKKQLKYSFENVKQLDKYDVMKVPFLIQDIKELSHLESI